MKKNEEEDKKNEKKRIKKITLKLLHISKIWNFLDFQKIKNNAEDIIYPRILFSYKIFFGEEFSLRIKSIGKFNMQTMNLDIVLLGI